MLQQNSEKFITFGFDHLLFKDSFSFLSSSLETLVKLNRYIEVDGGDVLIDNWQDNFNFSLNKYVNNLHDLSLLTEKEVYPYDYIDTWGRFDDCELPPKESF